MVYVARVTRKQNNKENTTKPNTGNEHLREERQRNTHTRAGAHTRTDTSREGKKRKKRNSPLALVSNLCARNKQTDGSGP